MSLVTAMFKPEGQHYKIVCFAGINLKLQLGFEWLFMKDGVLYASVAEPHYSVDENTGEWFWFVYDSDYCVKQITVGEFKFINNGTVDETKIKVYIGEMT